MFRIVYRTSASFARGVAYAGVALLVVAMLATVADIALRRTANVAVAGTIDITQLLVMAAAFMAIPFAFFADSHVSVELATDPLPPRAIAAFKALAAVLAAAFMAAVLRYGWDQALQQHGYGDRSQTIGIPILLYWAPLLAGSALSVAATLLIAIRHAAVALRGADPSQ